MQLVPPIGRVVYCGTVLVGLACATVAAGSAAHAADTPVSAADQYSELIEAMPAEWRDLNAQDFFDTNPFFYDMGGPEGAFPSRSCEELAGFFKELSDLSEYPCDESVRRHKQGLFAAIARWLQKEEPAGISAMEELVRRELACEDPVRRTLSVLSEPEPQYRLPGAEPSGAPPGLAVLPDFLDAYHRGAFPDEWPWTGPPEPGATYRTVAPRGPPRIMQYIVRWDIREPALATESYQGYLETENPRKLYSALLLADAEFLAEVLPVLVDDPGPQLPSPAAQVILAAVGPLPGRSLDHRFILEMTHPEDRNKIAIWLINQAARFTEKDDFQQELESYSGPLTERQYRRHLEREQGRMKQALIHALLRLPLLASEAEHTDEELEEFDRRRVLLVQFVPRVSPEVRQAMEQARTDANSEMSRQYLDGLLERIDESVERQQ